MKTQTIDIDKIMASFRKIDLYGIIKELGIEICAYGPNEELFKECGIGFMLDADGFAYAYDDGRFLIAYNETRPIRTIRYTPAHELGHILLGHVAPEQPQGRLIISSNPQLELEANIFASVILALEFFTEYCGKDVTT